MKHAIIFATLAMTLMPAHGSECTYTGADVGYAHCTTPEQKAHAFKSFCEDVDGAKGAYNEREDCARSLHPTCIYTDDPIVWRGQVVSEVFMNGRADGTGREYPKRYTAIIPDNSVCSVENGEETPEPLIALIRNGAVKGSSKWAGHHVEVRGVANRAPSGHFPTAIIVDVESIRDAP